MAIMVSVVIPVYNEEKALSRNAAYFKDLSKKAELVFVDGGSHNKHFERRSWLETLADDGVGIIFFGIFADVLRIVIREGGHGYDGACFGVHDANGAGFGLVFFKRLFKFAFDHELNAPVYVGDEIAARTGGLFALLAKEYGVADGVYFYHWVRRRFPDRADHIRRKLAQWGGNSAGVNIANIDNLGNVHPDTFWWDHSLGNVRERPFSEIWTDLSDPRLYVASIRHER